jgi:hypothetical protein
MKATLLLIAALFASSQENVPSIHLNPRREFM